VPVAGFAIIRQMAERPTFGKKIELSAKGKINIISDGVVVTIEVSAAPRKTADTAKKLEFPEGTLESLRPLLRQVLGTDISEESDSYWLDIDSKATMSTESAANKLKRAGKSRNEVARALVVSDKALIEKMPWMKKSIYELYLESKAAEVSEILKPYFSNKKRAVK